MGMQSQPHKNTVQDTIESALKKLHVDTRIDYGGRTDTGVHALNQSIDFLVPPFWQDLERLQHNLNRLLLPFIYIKKISFVGDSFHSRFCALKRHYRYVITDLPLPFYRPYTLYKPSLNLLLLKDAVSLFEGAHDFGYFKKEGSVTSHDRREIYKATVIQKGNFAIIKFSGNGFLRSQVRMMVDFLLKVSDKKLLKEDLITQLNKEKVSSRDIVIPNGLYFERVFYEKNHRN